MCDKLGQEPAFPIEAIDSRNKPWFQFGLTKREWYAGMAMMGLLATNARHHELPNTVAQLAYEQADAMLKEVEK